MQKIAPPMITRAFQGQDETEKISMAKQNDGDKQCKVNVASTDTLKNDHDNDKEVEVKHGSDDEYDDEYEKVLFAVKSKILDLYQRIYSMDDEIIDLRKSKSKSKSDSDDETDHDDDVDEQIKKLEYEKQEIFASIYPLQDKLSQLRPPGTITKVLNRCNRRREAELRKSNYYSKNTGNMVLLADVQILEKKIGFKVDERTLRDHFERYDESYPYEIRKIHFINNNNILIQFVDDNTAREAVKDARRLLTCDSIENMNLILVQKDSSYFKKYQKNI